MSFTKFNQLMITALLVILGSESSGFAQQGANSVGVVRISSPRTSSLVQPASSQSVQQTGGHGMGYSQAPCQSGNCPTGNGYQVGGCPTGNCPTGGCPTGNCPRGCRGGCFQGKFGEYYCKHSPDYGYSPPAKYPLQRRGVQYQNRFPTQWYGAGADYSGSYAPMVYQPTDTTQLGYKYQHVPFWQPMPNRLPPRPIPAQWNITAPSVQASRYTNGAFPGYMGANAYYAGVASAPISVNRNCPPTVSPSTQVIQQPQVAPQPVEPQPLQGQIIPSVQATQIQTEIDSGIDSELDGSASAQGALPPEPSANGNGF
jgi:hypothetical protein